MIDELNAISSANLKIVIFVVGVAGAFLGALISFLTVLYKENKSAKIKLREVRAIWLES